MGLLCPSRLPFDFPNSCHCRGLSHFWFKQESAYQIERHSYHSTILKICTLLCVVAGYSSYVAPLAEFPNASLSSCDCGLLTLLSCLGFSCSPVKYGCSQCPEVTLIWGYPQLVKHLTLTNTLTLIHTLSLSRTNTHPRDAGDVDRSKTLSFPRFRYNNSAPQSRFPI